MATAAKRKSNVVELSRNSFAEDAIVAHNLGKLMRAKAELDTATGNFRSVCKHIEAKGINLKAAKAALTIKKSGKVEETIEYLKDLFEYLLILGMPIEKKQLDLFRVDQHDRDIIAKARERGRYSGLMGHGTDQNPHAPDSEAGQAWLEAFHDGTEERNRVLAMESNAELIEGEREEDAPIFEEGDEE